MQTLVDAIEAVGISPNESDQNLEPANLVDGMFAIARAIDRVADSIYKLGVADAATPMGAIEALAKAFTDGCDNVSGSLNLISISIDEQGK